MASALQFFYPQPAVDMLKSAYQLAKADKYSFENKDFRAAMKVIAYATARTAMAGAIFYGINKYKTNALRTTMAGTLISTPATVLFWSGKLLHSGAQALHANYQSPFTRTFANAAFKTFGALFLSGCYKSIGFRAGLVEWQVLPRVFGNIKDTESPF